MASAPVAIRDWLEYSSVGGRELGLSLHEQETSLRIDLKSNIAFLENHQPASDTGGEPLGTSRAVVPLELADQLRDVLARTDLASVPTSKRDGLGRTSIRVKRTTDGTSVEAAFSNRDLDVLRGLAPLMQTLDDIVAFVAETPYQAIRLVVEFTPGPTGAAFTVTVKNVGSEPVFLPDLAELARKAADHHWFAVRIAEYPEPTPDYTPPPFNWVRVALAVPSAPSRRLNLLNPAREITFRTGAMKEVPLGVRHLVQAVFCSYVGEAVVDGHVVIRGRALSKALVWMAR